MKNIQSLDGLKRCIRCNLQPTIEINPNGSVTLICEQHGHQATGDNLEMAKKHWNMYITMTVALGLDKAA